MRWVSVAHVSEFYKKGNWRHFCIGGSFGYCITTCFCLRLASRLSAICFLCNSCGLPVLCFTVTCLCRIFECFFFFFFIVKLIECMRHFMRNFYASWVSLSYCLQCNSMLTGILVLCSKRLAHCVGRFRCTLHVGEIIIMLHTPWWQCMLGLSPFAIVLGLCWTQLNLSRGYFWKHAMYTFNAFKTPNPRWSYTAIWPTRSLPLSSSFFQSIAVCRYLWWLCHLVCVCWLCCVIADWSDWRVLVADMLPVTGIEHIRHIVTRGL